MDRGTSKKLKYLLMRWRNDKLNDKPDKMKERISRRLDYYTIINRTSKKERIYSNSKSIN